MALTQAGRPFRFKAETLGDDDLMIDSFQGTEGVSRLFHYKLRLLSQKPSLDLKGLLTKAGVLAIELLDGSDRYIHGNLNRLAQLEEGEDGLVAYEAEMVPWLWFLSRFHNCRIFQNLSASDIIEKVFGDRGFTDYRLRLSKAPAKRDYCVQYRETDLNFVLRLMEEEGIFYYFEHNKEKHTLVLMDNSSSADSCQGQEKARYHPISGEVEQEDTVSALLYEQKVFTGSVALQDYDFEKPKLDLSTHVSNADQKGEFYDYPGGYFTKSDGDRISRLLLEEREVELLKIRGQSTCRAFQSGFKFTLEEFYRDDANQAYTLLAVEHTGRNPSYRGGADTPFHYSNRFVAMPNSAPFRPPRITPKPIIQGEQTAVVVGKSGEEIWTDKYGRVKVQFHWDREGKDDENSSCWIRVAHAWAGKQWGSIYTPRIGQEVIVSFLEGDPDRPIITGRVYNADHVVPYTLPDEQTKSTLKSLSSKGGGGFNELRLEDKKGSEQIFIHGEKDLDVRIKNDRKEWIGQDRHLIVTRDKLEKVSGDKHLHVVGDRNEKVDGSLSLKVGMDVQEKAGMKYAVDAGTEIHLKSGTTLTIETGTMLTLKVGGNFISINSGGIFIKGTMVMINSGGAAGSGAGSSPQAPKDPLEADKAQPGQLGSVSPGQQQPPAKDSLASVSAPERASQQGAGAAGGAQQAAPSPAASVLQQAAQSGAPLCPI